MKPEGFMADIATAFFSTDDVELRHSIISNLGELIAKDAHPGDFQRVLPLCRDALYGPLKNEDHHRVADAALKTAGDAARCDPGTKSEIINLLLGFAARPEVTEENFIEAVEQLYRVDKSSLDTLAVTAQIDSPVARERLFSLISKK